MSDIIGAASVIFIVRYTMRATVEVIVRPKTREDVRREFSRFLERARSAGWAELKVLFGFAWGNDVYTGDWIEEILTPDQLLQRVEAAEQKGYGRIGGDDLFVTPIVTGVQHTFCHESDIHLEAADNDAYIASEVLRFRDMGWELHQRFKGSEPVAAPNGGPAASVDNSNAPGGPPSVS
jgi:hypothetical protein